MKNIVKGSKTIEKMITAFVLSSAIDERLRGHQ